MLILVDGYNVTMSDPDTRDLGKEAQRDALLARLATRGAGLLGSGSIVVVFDAREQLGLGSESHAGVRVVYAPDADAEIVRQAAGASQVLVVSNDMRLRARLSQDVSRRVEYRDASTCFEGAAPKRRRGSQPCVAEEGPLPRHVADGITAELSEHWGIDDQA